MPGLDPRRADLSVAGAVLLDTILRRLGADEISLCEMALREGLILDYIRRNQRHIAAVERYPDIRRRSVEELGERCHYWSEHARQVARMAHALFDQTAGRHGLGAREREWLEFGALLHDVGVHISYEQPSQALALPDPARRPARLRSGGGRDHRPRRPLSPPGDAEEVARGLRRPEGAGAAHRPPAVGLRPRRRGPRSQPLAGRGRPEGVGRRRRPAWSASTSTGDAELEQWAAERYLPPLETELDCPVRVDVADRRRRAGFAKAPGRARLFGDVVGAPVFPPCRRWPALEARPTTRARR